MDKDTSLQQNDNTTIGKIASAAGIVTGITGGVITAGVINIAILSLGTPILGPEVTVLINLTGGLYASFVSIKTSMNLADNYVTPTVRNILQTSADYLTKSKSTQQEIQLPMNVPNENKQLPAAKEPDHLPMKVSDVASPAISQKEKAANKNVSKLTTSSTKSSKPEQLKKPKIKSNKNSNTKNKGQEDKRTRG